MKKLILFSLLSFYSSSVFTQNHATLRSSSIEVDIGNEGSLIEAFRVQNPISGELTSILDHFSLCFSGRDEGYNLIVSVQGDSVYGFQAGIRDVPGLDRVWKVTRDEINQHRADFWDNGIIDNPIPLIIDWPAEGNSAIFPAVLTDFWTGAGYKDVNLDGKYTPEKGDYPSLYYPKVYEPEELVYVPFYNRNVPFTGQFDLGVQLYSFNCPLNPAADHTIFGESTVFFKEGYSSLAQSYFIDADIGNPNDDFIGSWPDYEALYFFNGDSIDEGGFEDKAPALVFKQTWGLTDPMGATHRLSGFTAPSITNAQLGMGMPEAPIEWYNYLTNFWKNGKEMYANGDGFSDESAPVTTSIFQGDPNEVGAWTEKNAGLSPQNRLGFANGTAVQYMANSVNRFEFSISYLPNGLETAIRPTFDDYFYHFPLPANFDPLTSNPIPSFDEYCMKISPIRAMTQANRTLVFRPNPVTNVLQIVCSSEKKMDFLEVFNSQGQVVFESKSSSLELDVSSFPIGLYVAKMTFLDGGVVADFFLKY